MPTREAPLLVTLGFDPPTFERLDQLRSRWFPPDRNVVPAHLCFFHQLPGEEQETIDQALFERARSSEPLSLWFESLKKIGGGLMLTVESPGLKPLRADLASRFARWLTPQDRQPFSPHVTIMNKADRPAVEQAWEQVRPGWAPWTGTGDRLILWRYRGGPWELLESYVLGEGSKSEDANSCSI